MNTTPKVTIIVAVLNSVKTIEKCITSCIEQNYKNKELIFIDGGSTDGTVEILQKYSQDINFWESEIDNGIYSAWNKGLRRSSGKWICFIGADDYWSYQNAISDLVNLAVENNVDIVSGRVAIVDKDNTFKRFYGEPWVWRKIKRHHCIAHPGMLHNRSCYDRIGTYNEKYKIAGDYDFSLRLGSSTKAIFINKVLVCMGDGGLSHSLINKTLSEVRSIQTKHPSIGMLRANFNYATSHLIILAKKTLGRL